MDAKKIERINELARLSKERALSPDEIAERAMLREEYRRAIRDNLRGQLSSIEIREKRETNGTDHFTAK